MSYDDPYRRSAADDAPEQMSERINLGLSVLDSATPGGHADLCGICWVEPVYSA